MRSHGIERFQNSQFLGVFLMTFMLLPASCVPSSTGCPPALIPFIYLGINRQLIWAETWESPTGFDKI